MSARCSVVILSYNEEVNIGRALDSVVRCSDDVYVVDSYSTDRTLKIAREKGAQVYQNPWENWAVQRNWALDNLPFKYDWVLFLDADEWMTQELKEEISRKLPGISSQYTAMLIRIKNLFLGKWLRHGGHYWWHFRLVRKGKASWIAHKGWEYGSTQGKVGKLYGHIMHECLKGVSFFIEKHNKYSDMDARQYFSRGDLELEASVRDGFVEGMERLGKKRRIWSNLPLFVRPFLHFAYRYFYKLGFLDGWRGFAYYFLHDLWYPFLVDVKIRELKEKKQVYQ